MNSQSAQWRLGKLLYLFRATELTISCAVAGNEGNFGGIHGFLEASQVFKNKEVSWHRRQLNSVTQRLVLLNDRTIFHRKGGWILDNESANGNEEAC